MVLTTVVGNTILNSYFLCRVTSFAPPLEEKSLNADSSVNTVVHEVRFQTVHVTKRFFSFEHCFGNTKI